MRIELIANANSGGGTDCDALTADLGRLGATVVQEGAERVVVAGGDGSLGAAAARAHALGVPLAVIATGTANDFARAHGLPVDRDEAVTLAARGERTRSAELAFAGDKPFVNVAAVGLAPRAARRAVPLKRPLGPLAYPIGALAAAVRERPVHCEATIRDRTVFAGAAWQAMVACTGAFGGGAGIDSADPQDGELDLVVVPAGSRLALLRDGLALRRGTIAELPHTVHDRAPELVLEVAEGTPFNLDGEIVRLGGRVPFAARPGLQLVIG